MNSTIDNLNQWGGQFLRFAWPMFWQSGLLIALVFAADLLCARKVRASVRHGLWLVVLVKLLLPPTLALPTSAAWWLFPAKPIAAPVVMPVFKPSAINTSVVIVDDPGPLPAPEPETVQPAPAPPRPKLTGAGWLLAAAVFISAGLLSWLLLRWWQLGQKVRAAVRIDRAIIAGNLEEALEQARRRAGFRAAAQLKLVEGELSPAVCGLFRPVILLPRLLVENLSPAQLQAVLLHEMIHLRRGDIWVNCAQSLLQIFYWWHPLLWLANARIRRVREEAVDDAVMLALGGEAETYAPTLLEVAKLAFRRPLLSLGLVGIMESRSALRQRIERLMNFRAPRKAGLTLASVCGIFVFSAVAVPMGQGPAPVAKEPAGNVSGTATANDNSGATAFEPSGTVLVGNTFTNLNGTRIARLNADGSLDLNPKLDPQQTVELAQTQTQPDAAAAPASAAVANPAASGPVAEPSANNPLLTSGLGDTNPDLSTFTGILTNPNFRVALHALAQRTGVETLGEPKITTITGRGENTGVIFPAPTVFFDPTNIPVLVSARFYRMPVRSLREMTSSLDCNQGYRNNEAAWYILADEFSGSHVFPPMFRPSISISSSLTSPEARLLNGSQILTLNGTPAEIDIGDGPGAFQFSCTPTLKHGLVDLAVQGQAIDGTAGNLTTNRFQATAAPDNFGGLLIRLDDPVDSTAKCLVLVVSAMALTNAVSGNNYNESALLTSAGEELYHRHRQNEAEMEFKTVLNLDSTNATAKHYLDLIKNNRLASQAAAKKFQQQQREQVQQIENTHLPSVSFTNSALADVLERLNKKIARAQKPGDTVPIMGATYAAKDIGAVMINVPPLKDAPLIDILDAIVKGADRPIQYYIQPYIIVFTAKGATNPVPIDGESGLFSEPFLQQMQHADQPVPEVHLKFRIIAVPKGTLTGDTNTATPPLTGIFTSQNAKTVWEALLSRPGAEKLAEPEATSLSGKQIEMWTTKEISVITNIDYSHGAGDSAVTPQTTIVTTGAIMEAVPQALDDGYAIHLSLTPSLTEFLGYDQKGQVQNTNGVRLAPRFETQKLSADLNLWDGQTVLLSAFTDHGDQKHQKNEVPVVGDIPVIGHLLQSKYDESAPERDVLVFVTATLVNADGSRVHEDSEMQRMPEEIPPQPAGTGTNTAGNPFGVVEVTTNLPPPTRLQLHLKARFIEVDHENTNGPGFDSYFGRSTMIQHGVGILTGTNTRAILRALSSQKGVETLAEPEITMLEGRQAQIRATAVETIVTNLTVDSSGAVVPQTGTFETGPVLDAIPTVLADGYTINLTAIPALTEFLGYKTTGGSQKMHPAGNDPLPDVSPVFQTQSLAIQANLYDNQTLVIGGFKDHGGQNIDVTSNSAAGSLPTLGRLFQHKDTPDKDVFVLITATIVDPTGSRVHSEDELPFAQTGVPPQPANMGTNSAGGVQITTNLPSAMHFQQRLQRIETPGTTNGSANLIGVTNDTALHERGFGMYTNYFLANLQRQGLVTNLDASTNLSATVGAALRKLFTDAGIDLQSPPGKSIYYNARLGWVFAKATPSDLDKIESVLENFVPPASPALRTNLTKLHHIYIPNVIFDGQSLPEALRHLNELAKQNDPDKTGVNFYIAANPDGSADMDMNTVLIQNFSLSNALLADVLDALQSHIDDRIKHSISDNGVVFFARTNVPTLSTRIFHLDRNAFSKGYRDLGPISGDTRLEPAFGIQGGRAGYPGVSDTVYLPASALPNPTSIVMDYLTTLGIDFSSPPGKSLGYDDRLGQLRVTATETDLDTIERDIQRFNQPKPKLHLQARFIQMDNNKEPGFSWYLGQLGQMTVGQQGIGILTSTNAQKILRALSSRKGVSILAVPETTLFTGHQAEMFIGQELPIITNVVLHSVQTPKDVPQLTMLETGQKLKATPDVLADGQTIQLKIAASDTTYWGYADPKTLPSVYTTNSSGLVSSPDEYLPAADSCHSSARVNVYDGQTVVFSLDSTNAKQILFAAPDEKREQIVAKFIENSRRKKKAGTIFVFLTASLVDDTGARIHSDEQLPLAQSGIPPQPPATNDDSEDFPVHPIHPKPAGVNTNIQELTPEQTARLESSTTVSLPVASQEAKLIQDGKLLYVQGKYSEAEAKLSEAARMDSGNAAVTYYLNLTKIAQTYNYSARLEPGLEANPIAVPAPNPYATNTLIHTGAGRQAIMAKLDNIHLDNVSFDGLPLSAVLDQLAQQCRLRDPQRKGINFLINNNPNLSGQPVSPPGATGTAGSEPPDIGSTIIKIPSLTDVRLADVLDAIVLTADHKIKYSIQDFGVMFSAKTDESPQLFMRTFRVDPNTFYSGLANVTTHTFGAYQNSGNGSGGDQNNGAGVGGVNPFLGGGNRQPSAVPSPTPWSSLNPFADIGNSQDAMEPPMVSPGNSPSASPANSGRPQSYQWEMITTNTWPLTPSAAARAFFTSLGINLSNPPGKSVFFNDRLGYLFVKATETDLDIIERALQVSNQTPAQIQTGIPINTAPADSY